MEPKGWVLAFLTVQILSGIGFAESVQVCSQSANLRSGVSVHGSVVGTPQRDARFEVIAWGAPMATSRAHVVMHDQGLDGHIYGAVLQLVPARLPRNPVLGAQRCVVNSAEEALAPSSPAGAGRPGVARQLDGNPGNVVQPGRFGLGVAAFSVGGGMPSVQYNITSKLTVRGLATIGSGFSFLGGELLFRFPTGREAGSSAVRVQPYLGGGVVVVNVDYSILGSKSFTGLMGSGGIFLRFRRNAHWQPYAEMTLIQFSLGEFTEPAVRGLGATIGFHYYF